MDMRVSSVYGAYRVQQSRPTPPVPRGAGRSQAAADSIDISSQASDYQYARNAVANAPDIRADLVNQIQNQLSSGTYSVSASDVAARIFHGIG